MTKPIRVQRKRTKGWRMARAAKLIDPDNDLPTVYVGRPTKWGNPFTLRVFGILNRLGVAVWYSDYLIARYGKAYTQQELRGKNLCCWCPLDQPCHADVLLELANELPH